MRSSVLLKAITWMFCLIMMAAFFSGCAIKSANTLLPEVDVTFETFQQPQTEMTDVKTETQAETQQHLPKTHIVTTKKELEQLSNGTLLNSGDTVKIASDFEVNSEIRLFAAVNFIIDGNVVCHAPVVVENYSQCDLVVTVGDGVDISALDLRYDMPKCNLIWKGEVPYDSEERIAEVMNVALYNGTDLRSRYGLGGLSWKHISKITATVGDNPGLERDLSWTVDGNVAKLYIDGEDSITVFELNVRVELSDTSVMYECFEIDKELFYTVKDCVYDTRVYKIITITE